MNDSEADNSIYRRESMRDIPESGLIIRCKAGNRDAFRELVGRYNRQAYAYAFSYVKCMDDAMCVSQDAFVRAWNAMGGFLEGRSFRPWLMSIVRNLALNHIEKKKSLREVSLDAAIEESGFDTVDTSSSPLEEMEIKELRKRVWMAVMGLKPEFREIIVLKHFQDCSYREISETLDIPEGTVMSRLYYARLELKKKLDAVELRS